MTSLSASSTWTGSQINTCRWQVPLQTALTQIISTVCQLLSLNNFLGSSCCRKAIHTYMSFTHYTQHYAVVPVTIFFWQEIRKLSVPVFFSACPITSRIYCCWDTVTRTFAGHFALLIFYSSKCYIFPVFYLTPSLLFHPLLTSSQFLQLPSCDLAALFSASDFKFCLSVCSSYCNKGK